VRKNAEFSLKCSNVSYRIGARTILSDINLELKQGEVLTIIGPNGGGKTTLAKIIIGIIPCSKGTVKRKPGLTIGYTPQKVKLNSLIPVTVRDFLLLNTNKPEDIARVHHLIDKHNLKKILNSQLYDISGGELQRVMLLKALAREPELLLLDEPTQALDINGQMEFYKFLEHTKQEAKKTVVIISHDLHSVMQSTDRVVCLNKTILCVGAPEQVRASNKYNELFCLPCNEPVCYYASYRSKKRTHKLK
jgi:zinc transport system ATP-binding protein